MRNVSKEQQEKRGGAVTIVAVRLELIERNLGKVTSWNTLLKYMYTAVGLWDHSISARLNQANIDTDNDDKTRLSVLSQIASKYLSWFNPSWNQDKYQGTPAYTHSLFQSLRRYLGNQSPSHFPHHRADGCENTSVDTDDKIFSTFCSLSSPACKLLVFYNPN